MITVRKMKNLDLSIFVIVACLIAISTIAIYSTTSGTKYEGMHITNLILFGVFIIPVIIISLLDFRIFMGKAAYILYGISIALLVLVLFKGENINGSIRWLSLGPLHFQPSELVKISTILLVAHLLNERKGEKLRFFKDLIPVCILFLIPVIFIMKQPDLGTSIVFIGIMVGMIWMGNIRATHMILSVTIIVLTVGTIIWLFYGNPELLSKIVRPHQLERIQTFLEPASDPDKAWHVTNSKTAIGSGLLDGEGLKKGFYIQNGYIPYAYSDSIYVVIGEEFGFIGSSVLLLLYFLLIYRMIIIAMGSKELSGSYLVVGIISMLVIQIFVNLGMHIGLLPLTGIALPFISYGGSTLLTNMLAIGIVLSVHTHRT